MKASHWNGDHPVDAPAHAVEVWIAHEPVEGGDIRVEIGYFDRDYRKWRLQNRDAIAVHGRCVIGWLPIEKPTYEVENDR